MTSLIISIISIVLVGLLTAATIFYLNGDAVTGYSSQAKTSGLINQATHINAATSMFFSDKGRNPETIQELVSEGYLQDTITGVSLGVSTSWDFAGDYAFASVGDEATCRALNKELGFVEPSGEGSLPGCSEIQSDAPDSVCCIPDAAQGAQP